MIKAIIFDWGGVLIEDPFHDVLSAIATAFHVPPRKFSEMFEPYNDAFHRGKITENDMWEKIALDNQLSKPQSESLWHDAFAHAYVVNEDVFNLAKQLKTAGYKIGFLSNTEEPAKIFFQKRNYDIFDATIFSCDEGFVKPEPEFYKAALQRLNVQAEEAVFIDDKEENVEAAASLGIHAIHFQYFDQLLTSLADLDVKIP